MLCSGQEGFPKFLCFSFFFFFFFLQTCLLSCSTCQVLVYKAPAAPHRKAALAAQLHQEPWQEGTAKGAKDMWRAYSDMREANYKNSDKYFHARGNYDAARRGPGGAWAAKVISDARENVQRVTDLFKHGDSGHGVEDSRADQAANAWGRSGKDPNHFRPRGLPDKY
uniref:Serum amyloid A protein n=2 Tax=Sus scrofa TaxID=9823 RepID=A0A4X1T7X5_PIG